MVTNLILTLIWSVIISILGNIYGLSFSTRLLMVVVGGSIVGILLPIKPKK